ncbi:hypothetical protein AB0878_31720 [Amycolatopsis sp. NPDC047767]|uniref:hypothetical protein n=1 Tax=Amycolatopsis sp. NPDC047767 TaxID=3156765 RepID=UPI003455E907
MGAVIVTLLACDGIIVADAVPTAKNDSAATPPNRAIDLRIKIFPPARMQFEKVHQAIGVAMSEIMFLTCENRIPLRINALPNS